jgi:hypothetical protein
MKHILFAAAATLSLATIPAYAGEGNYDPFPPARGPLMAYVPTSVTQHTGLMPPIAKDPPNAIPGGWPRAPASGGVYQGTPVTSGGVLPSNGSEGIVQSASSLPPGFADGTLAYTQAQSVQRYLLVQERARTPKLATR